METGLESTARYYREHWRDYLRDAPGRVATWNRWLARAARMAPEGAPLLEVGSGGGRDAEFLEDLGYKVTRTDACEGFLSFQRQHGHAADMLDILAGPATQQYGMVYSCGVLHHFGDPEFLLALRNMYKSLVPGGVLAYTVRRSGRERRRNANVLREDGRFFSFREPGQLWTWTESAGFIVTSMEYRDYGPVKEPGKMYGEVVYVIAGRPGSDDD